MSDTEAWGVVLQAGHWNCGGWTVDGRDGALVCGCGLILRDGPKAEATA